MRVGLLAALCIELYDVAARQDQRFVLAGLTPEFCDVLHDVEQSLR